MPSPTIIVADPIHSSGIERLRLKFEVIDLRELSFEADREAALASADAVIVRMFTADARLFSHTPCLKLVAKHGSGVDNIDIDAASRRRILVANTPGGANSTAVAEGAVTLMLSVLRRVREMDQLVREGRFSDRWRVALGDLWGKTLGLVGFGHIARATAKICRAGFDMKVLAYDPLVPTRDISSQGAIKVDGLIELASQVDVLSVHVPLSAATRHLVNARVLAAMRPTSILINTSRGGTVDEAALTDALERGRLSGAGLDVFEREPPNIDDALMQLPNVVVSPHVAGVTESSLRDTAFSVAQVVEDVFSNRKPSTLLNAELWEDRKQ